jgi:hypothetical protein
MYDHRTVKLLADKKWRADPNREHPARFSFKEVETMLGALEQVALEDSMSEITGLNQIIAGIKYQIQYGLECEAFFIHEFERMSHE